MRGEQEPSPPKKSRLVGCLVILLIVAAMLGMPFLAFLVLGSGGGGVAWPYLGLGFAFFALATLGGLRSGEIIGRHRSIKRADSPTAFYIGLTLYGLCALAMYLGYVVSLFC